MKRFLTQRQWRLVLFLGAWYAAYEVILIFVKRAYGGDPKILHVTDSLALNIVLSVALFSLVFAILTALLMHYMYGAKDE